MHGAQIETRLARLETHEIVCKPLQVSPSAVNPGTCIGCRRMLSSLHTHRTFSTCCRRISETHDKYKTISPKSFRPVPTTTHFPPGAHSSTGKASSLPRSPASSGPRQSGAVSVLEPQWPWPFTKKQLLFFRALNQTTIQPACS